MLAIFPVILPPRNSVIRYSRHNDKLPKETIYFISGVDCICKSMLLGLDLGDTGLCFSSDAEMTRKPRKDDKVNPAQKGLFPKRPLKLLIPIGTIYDIHRYYGNEKRQILPSGDGSDVIDEREGMKMNITCTNRRNCLLFYLFLYSTSTRNAWSLNLSDILMICNGLKWYSQPCATCFSQIRSSWYISTTGSVC